ncbi:MAG: glycosyltransferase family 39 protein, partial [Candidatus Acidiferrum sp.]
IAGQPNLHEMWKAIRVGFDTQTPGFYLIEHAFLGLISNKQLALRLPSILAFSGTLIGLFAYARRRVGDWVACLCALLLLSTSLFHLYLIEARGYSLMVFFITLALVCYQRLPSARWAALLSVSFIFAESSHYYAVFGMIPFFIAEAVRVLETRRLRWQVWVTLIVGASPLILYWPLLSTIKAYYGSNVFSRPSFPALREYYRSFFLLKDNTDNAIGIGIAVIALIAIAWSLLLERKGGPERVSSDSHPIPEGALLISLIALPYIVYPLVVLGHGALLSRYVLPTVIAIVLAIGTAVSIAGRKAFSIFTLFLVCTLGFRELTFWRHPATESFNPYSAFGSKPELAQVEDFVQGAGHPELPIVMSDCLLYSQVVYYLQPAFTNRLVYLLDERRELRYTKGDTNSKTVSGFREFFPLHATDFAEFTASHAEFLLYSEGFDWYTPVLMSEGYSLRLLAINYSYGQVYLVKRNHP